MSGQCPQCHNMEQYVRNICLTANMLYDLDGCCHYSDVIAAMKREHEQLAAAEAAFKNEVQIVIEQRDSIESLIWRFRDIQFPRDAVQTAIDLAKEVSDE